MPFQHLGFDVSDFRKGFAGLCSISLPKEISKAVWTAGNELLHDAIYEEPQAPMLEGHLRASARTQTPDGTMRPAGVVVGGQPDCLAPDGNFSLEVGFNIKYAHRWHEVSPEEDARIKWTTKYAAKPGRKYLETKLVRNKDRYLKLMGDVLANLLKKRGT